MTVSPKLAHKIETYMGPLLLIFQVYPSVRKARTVSKAIQTVLMINMSHPALGD